MNKLFFRPLLFLTVSLISVSCLVINPQINELDEVIYVRHEGADMPAYVHGNPNNKVFLLAVHGAGSFGLSFRNQAFTSQLENSYVVVYFDQRGQSMSQGHYSQPEDVIDLMAEDVLALVSVLKARYGEDITLFLMGHSMGGLITGLAVIKDLQERQFRGWIGVDGAYDLSMIAQARKDFLLDVAEEQINLENHEQEWQQIIDEIIEVDPESDDGYATIISQIRPAMKMLQQDSIVNSGISTQTLVQTILVNNPIHWRVNDLFNKPVNNALELEYSIVEDLSKIKTPALIAYGKYDMSVPPSIGQDAYLRLGSSNKKLAVFDRSIHHPFDSQPDQFAQEIVRFIELNR